MPDDSALSRLKQAVIHQKTAVFPSPPENQALEPLYQRLLAYNQRISSAVIDTIQSLPLNSENLQPDDELDQLIDQQSTIDLGREQVALKHYRSFKERIDQTRELVLQAIQERED